MSATILNGTKIAADIRSEVAAEVKALAVSGVRPGLARRVEVLRTLGSFPAA